MIDEIIHKASKMDNDTLYLIDDKLDKLDKFITQKIKITPKNKTEDKDKTIPKTIPKTKTKTIKIKIKIRLYLKLKLI